MTESLHKIIKNYVHHSDTEYYKNAKNRCNALSAVLRSVVQNCSGVDYDGGKRIATVLCADILDIADELDGMVEE